MTRTDIVNGLRERGFCAEATESVKNSVIFKGIIIKGEQQIAPVIYTDDLIEEAEKAGKSLDDVVEEVIRLHNDHNLNGYNLNKLMDRNFILPHVYIALQKESKENLIKKACELDGMEEYLYIRDENQTHGIYSIKVTPSYLKSAGISEQEMWESARNNTCAETLIQSMAQVMAELCGIPVDPNMEEEMPLFVLSNTAKHRGASAILNKEVLRTFAADHGVNRLLVLPSSVHEMLIVPYDPVKFDLEEMGEMVRQVNDAEVAPEEQLSDRAYLIDM